MTEYDIYCTNCGTVQASTENKLTSGDSVGDLITVLVDKAQSYDGDSTDLCVYEGKCVLEDYTIRRAEKEMVSLE